MYSAIKDLHQISKKYTFLFLVCLILTIFFSLAALVEPYIVGTIIDSIIATNQEQSIINGVLLLIFITFLRTIIKYLYMLGYENLSQNIIYELRQHLYLKLQTLDSNYYNKTKTGKILSRMTGDIEAIRHFYAWVIHTFLFNITIFVFALISMFVINHELALSFTIVVPFIIIFSKKLMQEGKPAFKKIREQYTKLNSVVQENISGNRVVKAYVNEQYEIEKFEIENQAYKDCNMAAAKVWEKYLPLLEGSAILYNLILILAGGLFVIYNKISIGELVTFSSFLWMINGPLRMLGWLINAGQDFATSYEKVKEFLQEKSEIKNMDKVLENKLLKGNIKFDNVSFKYENNPVLKNINFEVKHGQTVAIIGSTGSGKSTLTDLISRFYDVTAGTIYIDNIPITDLDLKTLRQSISASMQDVFLFSDTIEGNIAFGTPNATPKQIRFVSRIAGVEEFVYNFEENYNTIIGERGVGLSGGQKQRIALARALLQDFSVLILDDTTSALDMETEYKILTDLKKYNKQKTTLINVNRISAVKDADISLVLDKGEIIERGTHNELLNKKGYYYTVYSQQMGEFDNVKEMINLEKK